MNRDDHAAPDAEEEEVALAPVVLADEEILSDDQEAGSDGGEEEAESEEEEPNADDGEDESDDDDDVDMPLKDPCDDIRAFIARTGTLRPLLRRCVILQGLLRDPAPRFASAGRIAGVLRVYTEEENLEDQGEEDQQRQILLLYRYARFLVSDGGVVRRRTAKLHELRFVVPDDGDAGDSLRRWAGPALGPLIYPASHAGPLQELWARLASDVRVPPRAARVYLRADVGILRRSHYTPRRMLQVYYELGGMKGQTWPGSAYHVAMELRLPEPVVLRRPCEDEGEGEDKEECPVCLEELESGLAKWPGCSQPHVFHGECLELSLKESEKCPICRRRLSAPVDG